MNRSILFLSFKLGGGHDRKGGKNGGKGGHHICKYWQKLLDYDWPRMLYYTVRVIVVG